MFKNKKRKRNKKNSENLPVYNRRTLINSILTNFRNNPSKEFNYRQIAKKLKIRDSRTRELTVEVLTKLCEDGKIKEVYRGKFKFIPSSSYITGTVSMIKSGAAFIISSDLAEDVYVSSKNLNKALHGDKVKINIWARKKRKSAEGEVIEIIKRAKTDFVGIVLVLKHHAFLDVTEHLMPYDIFIPLKNLNGAKDGQKAIARITSWNEKSKNPTGKILDVLGDIGDNDAEMHAILTEFNLPYKFPEELEKKAQIIDAKITAEEIGKREDFRKVTTITIDPPDAKDFDDALSYRMLKNGNHEVGIHIADVTHYVDNGTAINEEAYNRGTSVYLVDRTVPMLPCHLSEFICSLRPEEEKLTYSAIFELNNNGDIKNRRFVRTIIKSDKRFNYEQAQNIIDSEEGDFAEELKILNYLAKKLKNKRFKNGAIAFERVETKFELDKNGKPLSIFFKTAKDSNRLIEEFMLLANRNVADFIGKQKNRKLAKSYVYRIHDEPDMEKLYNFSNFIRRFGYNLKINSEHEIADSLNKLLKEVNGKVEQNVVEQLAVRSMSKAVYSTENIGHYGLAFDYYTHFTSPIRRYPDMMVHRLLTHYLDGGKSVNKDKLEKKCLYASEMERRSVKAERASIKYKQVEFLNDKLGCSFDGVITGVSENGLFVEIKENKIEGMLHIREMDDDFYVYDEKNFCITGERKRKRYQIGDNIKIKLISANIQKRQIDFGLVN